MKKISVSICVYLWLIFSCLSISAQDFKTIKDGIEYAEITREIDKLPVKMNLLRLDLTKVRLDVVHAKDAAIGLEKTSSIAMRHGAIAAINAGFFRIDKSIWEGDDVSALMIDGRLLSEGNTRTSLLISNSLENTEIDFQKLGKEFTGEFKIGNFRKQGLFQLSGINRERKKDELILFTPEFHRTTLTDKDGIELIIKNFRIINIVKDKGSSLIPDNGFVLSISGEKIKELMPYLKVKAAITFGMPDHRFYKKNQTLFAEDIVSGVPQLIKDGKIDITWEEEKSSKSFVETKHPRTAVAKLKDGKFLMVTVDGRSEASGGVGLQDLAAFLLEMGATDAMNLDGGGSSTMFLDGKIVNHPSDKEGERSVGDAILVFPRK